MSWPLENTTTSLETSATATTVTAETGLSHGDRQSFLFSITTTSLLAPGDTVRPVLSPDLEHPYLETELCTPAQNVIIV
jgi:hypothetical protein